MDVSEDIRDEDSNSNIDKIKNRVEIHGETVFFRVGYLKEGV